MFYVSVKHILYNYIYIYVSLTVCNCVQYRCHNLPTAFPWFFHTFPSELVTETRPKPSSGAQLGRALHQPPASVSEKWEVQEGK
jgi:hypothetical protein